MRVFLHEYVSSELAENAAIPACLRAEGQAMFRALLDDFQQIPGVEVPTLTFDRPASLLAAELKERFRDLARQADFTLVVAPEFDQILASRCRWVKEAGGRLLGPSQDAIRLASDKFLLSRHLHEQGVPTPACRVHVPGEAVPAEFFPAVCKPRFGAGCQGTFLLQRAQDLDAEVAGRIEECAGAILQPYIPGLPASVAFLIGPAQTLSLLPASQEVSAGSRLQYHGGVIPLPPPLAARARRLGQRAIEAVSGLRGYVGVDLILGEAADGSEDFVIEINPRVTTSYVGLRALAESNLAGVLLRLVAGESDIAVGWRPGRIRFWPDGKLQSQLA